MRICVSLLTLTCIYIQLEFLYFAAVRMVQTQVCRPLTEKEYAQVFSTFMDSSTEYPQIMKLSKPLVDEFEGKAIDLMSIGAGTGCIENDLIKQHNLNVKSFIAIEPNEAHLEKLKQTVAAWGNIKMEIDSRYFDEKYETLKRFDMILMSHSMYCMDNPVAVIIKAKSLLKSDGKLVIFSQTEKGGHELYARMKQEVDMDRPINNHFVTSKFISKALRNNAIKHDVKMGPSHIDVTDFIKRRITPKCNDNITFLLQTDYLSLSGDLQEAIYEMVRERVTTTENGKQMFSHPTGMVVVYNREKCVFQ